MKTADYETMLHLWAQYAADHKKEYEAPIGEDYVLGPAWEALGDSIRTLLNGQTGRLDCSTLDAFILETMHENGVDSTERKSENSNRGRTRRCPVVWNWLV